MQKYWNYLNSLLYKLQQRDKRWNSFAGVCIEENDDEDGDDLLDQVINCNNEDIEPLQ